MRSPRARSCGMLFWGVQNSISTERARSKCTSTCRKLLFDTPAVTKSMFFVFLGLVWKGCPTLSKMSLDKLAARLASWMPGRLGLAGRPPHPPFYSFYSPLPHQKPKNTKNMDFVTAGVSNNDLRHVEAYPDRARSVEMLF